MFVVTLVLSSVLIVCVNANTNTEFTPKEFCGDFKPQGLVDIDNLLNNWYVIEILFHGSKNTSEEVKYNPICPTINLSQIDPVPAMEEYNTDNWNPSRKETQDNMDELMEPLMKVWREVAKNNNQHRKDGRRTTTLSPIDEEEHLKKLAPKKLRLLWNERETQLEYSLRYNISRPGFWMSFGTQNGSLETQYGYTPFIGTIQVLRAVHNHVILTFCHISVEHQFFSLVISREPHMTEKELKSIRDFFHRKHLHIGLITHMCALSENIFSSAVNASSITALTIILSIFSIKWFHTVTIFS